MAFRNTNTDKPNVGGVHSVNQPKLPEWIEDVIDTAGEIIDAGKDISDFMNGEDGNTTVGDLEEGGGTKNAQGNEWDWWNPFSWAKWPWEGTEASEGGEKGVTTKWIIVAVVLVAASYIFLRVFKGANNSKW